MDASDALVRYCERRMTFALDRFRTVERVGVRLHELGPRSATCLAIAHVEGHAPIVVRVASDGAYDAVDVAAAKLAEAVARALDRALRERIVVALRESQRARRRARS
jgi:ribosome-associated translation inhibitor RaiA